MNRLFGGIAVAFLWGGGVAAHASLPVAIDIITPDGGRFREIPVASSDGAARSYLQAKRGARYQVRVRNTSGGRLGLVIAVDGRNIISGRKSELGRDEPMYVIEAGDTQDFAGWRASLDAVNEFYFTDWNDSYAEAFGDRSARGVIAVAVYEELAPEPPPPRAWQPSAEDVRQRSADAASAPAAKSEGHSRADESVGTGYGERREDHVTEVRFVAQSDAASRHFIKYEWRDTLCRKRIIDCATTNRFWDESTLGFAPPPPRRGGRD